MNHLFPLNLLIMLVIIIAAAYVLRCMARIFAQTFKAEDYNWREVFKPYRLKHKKGIISKICSYGINAHKKLTSNGNKRIYKQPSRIYPRLHYASLCSNNAYSSLYTK